MEIGFNLEIASNNLVDKISKNFFNKLRDKSTAIEAYKSDLSFVTQGLESGGTTVRKKLSRLLFRARLILLIFPPSLSYTMRVAYYDSVYAAAITAPPARSSVCCDYYLQLTRVHKKV